MDRKELQTRTVPAEFRAMKRADDAAPIIEGRFISFTGSYQIAPWATERISPDVEIEGEDIMNLEEAVEEILDKGREMEYAEREDLTPNYNVQVKVKHKNNKKFLKATFTDLKTSEVKSKCYFTYEPDTVTLNRGQCAEFANDMKQIWYSKGKDIESDEAWTKFAERMMKVVQGKEELHCKAYLYLKVDPKNSHFVKEIWLPEDWKQLRITKGAYNYLMKQLERDCKAL